MQVAQLAGANSKNDAQRSGAVIPFTRAAAEHVEPGGIDVSVSAADFGAGPKQLGPYDVTAFGYLRRIAVLVTASSGAAGLNNAVANADAPWNVIKSISFHDVNGQYLAGPFSGYDLMLINKWGGYGYNDDPTAYPYSAVATSGNFTFLLYIPVEIVGRDALGSLPNMNAASTFKVSLTVADNADVYSTSPDTLPGLRIQSWVECWTKPNPADPFGNAQAVEPPIAGATQFWTKSTYTVASGNQTVRLTRVGNYLRNLILVFRDSGAAREGDTYPDPLEVHLDGQPWFREGIVLRRSRMAKLYGYTMGAVSASGFDEGVAVYPFTHDFDGKPGGEIRDLWHPTVQSTRLEIVGNFGESGTLEVLTNDIFIPGMNT